MNPERKRQKTQIIVPLHKWAIYKTLLEADPAFLESVVHKKRVCLPLDTRALFCKSFNRNWIADLVSLRYSLSTHNTLMENLWGVSTDRYRDRFTFVFPSNKNELIERYVHLCGSFPILEKVT